MTPKCYILVGVPASGKSTWLANRNAERIASSDAVIDRLAADNNTTYDQIFSKAVDRAQVEFWSNVKHFAKSGETFYVDRTNTGANARKKIIDVVKSTNDNYEFVAVVFLKPEYEEWQRRLTSRVGKSIPQHVLDQMVMNFSMPSVAEGFSQILVVN